MELPAGPPAGSDEVLGLPRASLPAPLEPLLAVAPPNVLAVTETTARIEWAQATMSVPETADPRQLEVQLRTTYSVPHELQMQELPLPLLPAGAHQQQLTGEALLVAACSRVVETDWRTVHEAPCCSAEVRGGSKGCGGCQGRIDRALKRKKRRRRRRGEAPRGAPRAARIRVCAHAAAAMRVVCSHCLLLGTAR